MQALAVPIKQKVMPQQQTLTSYTLMCSLYSPRFLAALPPITFVTSLCAAAIAHDGKADIRIWQTIFELEVL